MAAPEPAPAKPAGPMSDLVVVEMGTLIAGPFCGQILGDFGAEVIKIEDPRNGDPMRQWGRTLPKGLSPWWPVIARNKKSVTLDLRTPEGQEIARTLIAKADVVIENFRPGALEKWGLGWAQLSELNPRLIMARISGFGQTGPYAGRAGFGLVGESMGGLRYITGDPDRPPARAGISIGDSLTGMHAALGISMAVHARDRTGRGQLIDAALYESVFAMMENLVTEYDLTGYVRERSGSILPGLAPSNIYPCAEDEMILIGANGDRVFERLAAAMSRPELKDDPRFCSHQSRGEHQAVLDALIADWTRTRALEGLLALMEEHGVPASRVYRAPEMLADPQFAAREAIIEADHPVFGGIKMQNAFPKLSETPGSVRWAGPALGEHTEAVLRERAGCSDGRIEELRRKGVI